MAGNDGTILIDGAQVMFRNFAGREGPFNAEGDRSFCVFIDPEMAAVLRKDGWNVKQLKVREPGDTPQDYLQVSVKYRGRNGAPVRPPTIMMITSAGKTALTEDEVEIFDWLEIENVDLIIRPYQWSVSGKSGVKAYLKSFYLTVKEDQLALRYKDVPDIDGGARAALPSGDDKEAEAHWDDDEQLALER